MSSPVVLSFGGYPLPGAIPTGYDKTKNCCCINALWWYMQCIIHIARERSVSEENLRLTPVLYAKVVKKYLDGMGDINDTVELYIFAYFKIGLFECRIVAEDLLILNITHAGFSNPKPQGEAFEVVHNNNHFSVVLHGMPRGFTNRLYGPIARFRRGTETTHQIIELEERGRGRVRVEEQQTRKVIAEIIANGGR